MDVIRTLITLHSRSLGDHSQQLHVDVTKHEGQDEDTAVLSASGEDSRLPPSRGLSLSLSFKEAFNVLWPSWEGNPLWKVITNQG